jgi:hypothetical protein
MLDMYMSSVLLTQTHRQEFVQYFTSEMLDAKMNELTKQVILLFKHIVMNSESLKKWTAEETHLELSKNF